MGTNPKHKKSSQSNKTFQKNTSKKQLKSIFLNDIFEEEFTIEHQAKGISKNEIKETLRTLWRIKTYSHRIQKILFKHMGKIKYLNDKFDKIACKKVHILSLDETFKGMKIIILVMIDAITGYIICVKKIKNRKEKTITKALQPYKKLLEQVDLVLTDGANYFPEVINKFLPNARHQICLVHVLRNLFKHLEPYQKAYKNAQKEKKETNQKIDAMKNSNKNRRYKLKKIKQQHAYNRKKRDEMRVIYGVKKSQKGILKKYPYLRVLNLKINSRLSSITSMTKTLKRNKRNLKILDNILMLLKETRDLKWGDYMVQYRMLYRFYNLFRRHSSKYRIARKCLITTLTQTGISDFYKEIHRILTKTIHLDTVNLDDCPVRIDRNFINTNAVESINAKLRPFFDRLKNIKDTKYMRAIFDLIKLRLNTSPPYSGIRKNSSPIERYGYNLKGRTFIDLIFRGLPPGPQYGLFSSQINLAVANPNMVGKVKIAAIE